MGWGVRSMLLGDGGCRWWSWWTRREGAICEGLLFFLFSHSPPPPLPLFSIPPHPLCLPCPRSSHSLHSPATVFLYLPQAVVTSSYTTKPASNITATGSPPPPDHRRRHPPPPPAATTTTNTTTTNTTTNTTTTTATATANRRRRRCRCRYHHLYHSKS
jgi:hypothetical protein